MRKLYAQVSGLVVRQTADPAGAVVATLVAGQPVFDQQPTTAPAAGWLEVIVYLDYPANQTPVHGYVLDQNLATAPPAPAPTVVAGLPSWVIPVAIIVIVAMLGALVWKSFQPMRVDVPADTVNVIVDTKPIADEVAKITTKLDAQKPVTAGELNQALADQSVAITQAFSQSMTANFAVLIDALKREEPAAPPAPTPAPTTVITTAVAECPQVISPEKDWRRVIWDCANRVWQDKLPPEGATRPAFECSFTAPREMAGKVVFNGFNANLYYDSDKDGVAETFVVGGKNGVTINLVASGWYKVRNGASNGGFEILKNPS